VLPAVARRMEEGSEKMTKAAERGRIFAEEVGREQQQWRTGGWFCFGKRGGRLTNLFRRPAATTQAEGILRRA
jgi:hypothetical protein